MSITNGPNLGLMVNGLQGEAHYSQFMAFLRGMDGLVMPNVKGYLTNTPPGSPSDGDCYIIGAAPTGAWAGQGGKVARYSTVAAAWEFYTPKNGWMLEATSARESYRYTGSAWEIFYREGTWTPTFIGDSPAGTGQTYSTQDGTFTKIGRAFTVRMYLGVSSKGTAGGNALIGGFPFTASANYHDGYFSTIAGVTYPASTNQIGLRIAPSSSSAGLIASGSAGAIAITVADVGPTPTFIGTMHYHN